MRDLHRRLAQVGLAALAERGFVLAGGYAITEHGIGDRPSQDVDLFTDVADPDGFAVSVATMRESLLAEGFSVSLARSGATFAHFTVADPATGESGDLQLALDFREFPPARVQVGPVLDVQDAVGNKMTALYSRAEARDYIDIDNVLASGRFTRSEVLDLADRREAQPLDRTILIERLRAVGRYGSTAFAQYGVGPEARDAIVARFHVWADDLQRSQPDGAGNVPEAARDAAAAAGAAFPGNAPLAPPSRPSSPRRPQPGREPGAAADDLGRN